ncbi:Maf/Ham1 [Dacryopinax primogenitus]|uniref:Maf/Ham1 n=1 Tax=Dacryopinax primogenitus (strain DJM 731) TaxID=1858805 RepID=M5G409_DACPD|nr:Maf/Ham1 [Dacryopinax primogenitus]EJU04996.1 Maf/Ham1 [Dacryopinax primogenitus]
MPHHNPVLDHALRTPAFIKLAGKRVVLASNSPRRREILRVVGLEPEVVPSTFAENLSQRDFESPYEYPVATATHKAVEVYERLVKEDPEDPPDLVIAADTVVLSSVTMPVPGTSASLINEPIPEILEKPSSQADNLRMLLDLNGQRCEVVTGITIVYPVLAAPGYAIQSIDERSFVYFADSPVHLLEAYADCREGIDRAGGFAVQGRGGLLISRVEGDYNNVVGFPVTSFFHWLEELIEEDEDFLE